MSSIVCLKPGQQPLELPRIPVCRRRKKWTQGFAFHHLGDRLGLAVRFRILRGNSVVLNATLLQKLGERMASVFPYGRKRRGMISDDHCWAAMLLKEIGQDVKHRLGVQGSSQ